MSRWIYCLNSDDEKEYSKRIVTAMATALGKHPQLIAWQIDNGIGGHTTEFSFNNPETRPRLARLVAGQIRNHSKAQ